MSTALQLVNRIRRLFREEDASDLTDELSTVLLDLVNESKRDVLESRVWDFDRRQDGVLQLVGDTSVVGALVVTTDLTTMTLTGGSPAIGAIAGNHVSRIVATDDANYGDTAFRIVSATNLGAFGVLLTLETAWKGATDGTANFKHIVDEYLLPTTVRQVTSVRHQESDVRLHEMGKEDEYDVAIQRPHEDVAERLTDVYVGSTITTTYNTGTASAGTTGMGLRVHPTPSTGSVIHYAYIYRHPTLSATQSLDNVDGSIEDVIVRLAYARAMMFGVGNEPQAGALIEQEALTRANELWRGHIRQPLQRRLLRPNFGGGSVTGFGRLPRNVGSL